MQLVCLSPIRLFMIKLVRNGRNILCFLCNSRMCDDDRSWMCDSCVMATGGGMEKAVTAAAAESELKQQLVSSDGMAEWNGTAAAPDATATAA